jgi:RNA polymerase sigma-70 factor (ECF subfamily)
MSAADPNDAPKRFLTTHWSLVVAARDADSPEARTALAALCEAYWYPLYIFIRRQGHSMEAAQDLTQEFLARLIEKDVLEKVDEQKGKFRSFLLAACKHFLANERDRDQAQKRGGGREFLSIDARDADSRYVAEPSHNLTPEKLFERRWALVLLQQVLARLRDEFKASGKVAHFERLKVFLTDDKTSLRYAQAAEALHLSGGAVKVAVHRLRRRYRELLREEIARTVHDPSQVDADIRDLFTALGS